MLSLVSCLCFLPLIASSYKSPHFSPNRSTIVHLFEWKWSSIASECENFLQHKAYAGVQVSPPNENLIIDGRPWWERYQPVSYVLITRSGNASSFADMVKRCNAVGVRIYVDAVINHMSAGNGVGTGGSLANASHKFYPGVPYGPDDFNKNCEITNFDNNENARNCELVGLKDLNQSKKYVKGKIIEYLNHLIDLGVAGFRIDAARHMWPSDLREIYSNLKNLNTEFGFAENLRPFIYQEVPTMDKEYTKLGALVEFNYGKSLSNVFRGNDKLKWLVNWGPSWGLIDGSDAVAFIDNHDTQRDKNGHILSHKKAKQYKMAVAFMLAHPYGTTRIISSYAFNDFNQGPPADKTGDLIPPNFNKDNTCGNGYVCEHRWREIYSMVQFRNVVAGTGVENFWSNDDQQISFCRGNKGFIVFTNWGDVERDLQTCLPPGIYCDVISGSLKAGNCTGKAVRVKSDGKGFIRLGALEFNGVLTIHEKSKLK
ncbi:alpha-amylase [Tribolium castaneum]|uniref:Alpha-amylase n=1 Tax=Tribolium castaneum TaxID=7070 RepID=D6W968_TRICA|nr:PREDICTED: alpha-amylase [Tribolium castaneum]EEZ98454.1 Alpha-amylase-related protein-like Protein [Tribolium castaneum]|eukprot:XP_008201470.1 PREDICTED: alpha-amylase [Tribolium castaneum]